MVRLDERFDKKTSIPAGGFNVTDMTNDLPRLQLTVGSGNASWFKIVQLVNYYLNKKIVGILLGDD